MQWFEFTLSYKIKKNLCLSYRKFFFPIFWSNLINMHFKVTTGVLGSCFLYSLVETLFGRREDDIADNKHMSESWIIFLLSLPYLIDFFSGCMSFYFTYLIITLEDERHPKRNKVYKSL